MGQGPIPWDKIEKYASRYEMDSSDDFEMFDAVIRSMDNAYLEESERKREKKEKSNG